MRAFLRLAPNCYIFDSLIRLTRTTELEILLFIRRPPGRTDGADEVNEANPVDSSGPGTSGECPAAAVQGLHGAVTLKSERTYRVRPSQYGGYSVVEILSSGLARPVRDLKERAAAIAASTGSQP